MFIFIRVSRGAECEYFVADYLVDVAVLCFLVEFVLFNRKVLQAKPFEIYCFLQSSQTAEHGNLKVVVQVRSIPETHNFECGERLECLLWRLA